MAYNYKVIRGMKRAATTKRDSQNPGEPGYRDGLVTQGGGKGYLPTQPARPLVNSLADSSVDSSDE
jgi:hypothetical protein